MPPRAKRSGCTGWMKARAATWSRGRRTAGLAYWSDGKGDDRILLISPGFQLVALNAKTGRPMPGFGDERHRRSDEGLDRAVVKPGQIGSSSPAIVVRDTVVVGAALLPVRAAFERKRSRLYSRLRCPHRQNSSGPSTRLRRQGELGNETWENDSWKYSGNTGAWAPLSGTKNSVTSISRWKCQRAIFTAVPVLATISFPTAWCVWMRAPASASGITRWFTTISGIWISPPPPILIDITVEGEDQGRGAVTKQGFTYVFDRVTGKPVWPIVERPVPQSDVPGEKTAATQPFPTKPPPSTGREVARRPDRLHAGDQSGGGARSHRNTSWGRCLRRPLSPTPTARRRSCCCLPRGRRELAGRRGRSGDRNAVCGLGH